MRMSSDRSMDEFLGLGKFLLLNVAIDAIFFPVGLTIRGSASEDLP